MKQRTFLPLLICSLTATAYPAATEDHTPVLPQETAATSTGPAALTQALKAAGPKATIQVVPATTAAIQALGPEATPQQVAALVYAAVRVTPDSALNIVRAAVKLSPEAAPEIAAAAARAVTNPWKEVRYQKGAELKQAPQPPPRKEPDFKSPPVDASLLEPVEEVLDPAAVGDPMSLAEAIVQTAVAAGGELAPVQKAVDAALFGDPGLLFNRISSARSISGVGDAGDSNYANEPNKAKLAAPNTPNPSVVSK